MTEEVEKIEDREKAENREFSAENIVSMTRELRREPSADKQMDSLQLYMDYIKQEEIRKEEELLTRQQIYASYGITLDKVEGASEYYNAMFKGVALLSVAITMGLILVSSICCGITSTTTVFALASLAVEGLLFSQESIKNTTMIIISRVVFLLPVGMTTALMVCDLAAVSDKAYGIVLIVFEGITAALTLMGGTMYFFYNPYHERQKQMHAAKAEIKQVMKEQKKAEKRAKKKTESQKKKEQKRLHKLEQRELRQSERRQFKALADKIRRIGKK